MSPAICLSLDQSKILSSGNGLILSSCQELLKVGRLSRDHQLFH